MAFKPIKPLLKYDNAIAQKIIAWEWEWYYKPILDVLNPKEVINDNNILNEALRSGQIYYQNGGFYSKSGRFSNAIAKELESIGARYSKYGRCYRLAKGKLPQQLMWTIETINAKTYTDVAVISKIMTETLGNLDEIIKNLKLVDIAEEMILNLEKRVNDNLKANKIETIAPKMTDFRAREFAKNYTDNFEFYIKKWQPEEIVKMREKVGQMALDGESRITIADYIKNQFKVSQRKAKFLARNESSIAVAEYLGAKYQEEGFTEFKWITNLDGKERKLHKELNSKIFRFDDPPVIYIDEKRGIVQKGLPGETYNCLTGDMHILSPFPNLRIFKRQFAGELTELVLPMGTLKITANHPVLTDKGWVAAKSVQIGDKVAKISNKAFFGTSTNPDYSKTRIDEFFSFYSILFNPQRINTTNFDFHGDVSIDNKVDVINIESKLINHFKPEFNKSTFDLFLSKANESGYINPSNRTFFKAFPIGTLAPCSKISLMSQVFSFFFSSESHSIIHTFGAVSWLDSILDKSIGYNTTRNPEFFCKLFNTSTLSEQTYKLILWDIFNFVINEIVTEFSSTSSECFLFNAKQLSNISQSHSFGIEFDTVQNKIISTFNHNIYNLENKNNWYYTENYITKNCRCTFIPVLSKAQLIDRKITK